MKISVSTTEEDVRFLDEYARKEELSSRSAAFAAAVAALKTMSLGDMYESAWAEFDNENPDWDATLKDGLSHEAW